MPPTQLLRRRLRRTRRSLSSHEQQAHSLAVARSLGKHTAYLRARRIGVYWGTDGELDPSPLARLSRGRQQRCFLPVLRACPHPKLWFLEHRFGDPLTKNRFGIPEPRMRNRRVRLPWELDLLLVPLVGFDRNCNRLGMGGGYYDRTLAYLRWRQRWHRPMLIGVAHECQRVEALPTNPWDIPLDLVVTERRIYARKGG